MKEELTPEEQIDKEFWYALRQIKKESLLVKTGSNIDYWVYPNIVSVGDNTPSASSQIKILGKLEELGVIKILNPGGTGEYET